MLLLEFFEFEFVGKLEWKEYLLCLLQLVPHL